MPDVTTTTAPAFTIERVFDAPRELLWQVWTDPDEAPYWLHPRDITTPRESVDYDLRPGGAYRYTMIAGDGSEYPTVGRYREVTPPERLVFTWGSPGDDDDEMPLITVDLAEHGPSREQTRMTFHVQGIAGQPGDRNVYDGWAEALDLLAERVAAR
jgi:uncharacterized protein YndB with AHSA1/START domain